MKRHAEHNLGHWYAKANRKPLIIRGARQVGKSTIVRNFAKRQGLELIEINLEKHKRLNKLFETKNLTEICHELEYLTDSNLGDPKGKILFLDEIQATPEAIACLRYFYEEMPKLAVISAGSLLEFSLTDHNFSMPVGRIEYLYLGPMSFMEFLEAGNHLKLKALISTLTIEDIALFPSRLPQSAHEKLSSLLRDFILVGGMPEAVSTYLNNGNFDDVIDVHLSIIETYQDDFAKYARHSQLDLIQTVFQYVPQGIGNKVKFSNIAPHAQARDVKSAIDLLAKAGVVKKVYHSSASGLPIAANINTKVFKLYFLDIGLVNTMCGTKNLSLELLRNINFTNTGNLAEQFIAQHLVYAGRHNASPELFYWLREAKTGNAEVDFIMSLNEEIVPIEVKAGKSGTLKSLHQFAKLKHNKRSYRFDLNPPSKQTVQCHLSTNDTVDFELISLPLYMAQELKRLAEES